MEQHQHTDMSPIYQIIVKSENGNLISLIPKQEALDSMVDETVYKEYHIEEQPVVTEATFTTTYQQEEDPTEITQRTAETDEDNDRALIHAVHGHNCLWDAESKNYYNKSMRDGAWEQIASKIPSFCFDVKQVKKRWKAIKDSYGRNKRHRRSLAPDDKRPIRIYKYSSILNFLDRIPKPRKNEAKQANNSINSLNESTTTITNAIEYDEIPQVGVHVDIPSTDTMRALAEFEDEDIFGSMVAKAVRRVPHQHRIACKIKVLETIGAYEQTSYE